MKTVIEVKGSSSNITWRKIDNNNIVVHITNGEGKEVALHLNQESSRALIQALSSDTPNPKHRFDLS